MFRVSLFSASILWKLAFCWFDGSGSWTHCQSWIYRHLTTSQGKLTVLHTYTRLWVCMYAQFVYYYVGKNILIWFYPWEHFYPENKWPVYYIVHFHNDAHSQFKSFDIRVWNLPSISPTVREIWNGVQFLKGSRQLRLVGDTSLKGHAKFQTNFCYRKSKALCQFRQLVLCSLPPISALPLRSKCHEKNHCCKSKD